MHVLDDAAEETKVEAEACPPRRGFLRLAAAAVGTLVAAPVLAKTTPPPAGKTSTAQKSSATTRVAGKPASATDTRTSKLRSVDASGRRVTERTSRVREVYKPHLRSREGLARAERENLGHSSRGSVARVQPVADTTSLQAPAIHTEAKTLTPDIAFRSGDRAISLYAPNTGEAIRSVFWTPRTGYVSQSIKELSWALRDHHNDEFKLFDERAFDIVYAMQLLMGTTRETHVISGYRSPETNSLLREESRGVAKNSFHIQARAVDLRMPGVSLAMMHRAALSLRAGGVGYYPRSNFIHVDTGPVRSWG